MKRFVLPTIAAILLGSPLSRARAFPNAEDAAFLKDECRISQTGIQVMPKLSDKGQAKLQGLLAKRDCAELKAFQSTREYLKKYTPPPSVSPKPPKEYDIDFLTQTELDYINHTNKLILARLMESFGTKKR